MKHFDWDDEKNELLKHERGITFEEVVFHIENGDVLDVIEHPNAAKYRSQKIYILDIDGYAYLVPFVEEEDHFFLKTVIPSRKATRDLIVEEDTDDET